MKYAFAFQTLDLKPKQSGIWKSGVIATTKFALILTSFIEYKSFLLLTPSLTLALSKLFFLHFQPLVPNEI